ncbi:MAG: hypothetical protein BWK80_04340 [Desulfobacteraceae bacterium IS3]|nr:MAG: hypothetical protein BWK80_04340 [Desulfobacteraceae bacterium IS3]
MQILEAEVTDSNHLKLLSPIGLPPGSKIKISVEDPCDISDERETWLRLSLKNFESAFGDDEPEYSPGMIKELNKEFKP